MPIRATVKLAFAIAAGCFALAELVTTASAAARPNRVSISYVAPKNPAHQPIYQRLKEARFLEKLQGVLSPFRLPRRLLVTMRGCDGEANAWYEDNVITVCYEYIDEIYKNVPAETTSRGVTPIDALVGPVFDTCLHEFGHALFEILELPVFGREEDAADQVAAYLVLQLGREPARRLIGGTARAYMTEADAVTEPPKQEQYANEHGTPAQRFYNLLCIAYGADPKFSEDLVTKGHLPKGRAENCEDEYMQVALAFEKLVRPHIDRRLAKKVMDKSWLPSPTTKPLRRPGATPSAPSN